MSPLNLKKTANVDFNDTVQEVVYLFQLYVKRGHPWETAAEMVVDHIVVMYSPFLYQESPTKWKQKLFDIVHTADGKFAHRSGLTEAVVGYLDSVPDIPESPSFDFSSIEPITDPSKSFAHRLNLRK